MSVSNLILHVGMQKTGTSSIQATLNKNRDCLKEDKLLYPESWSAWHVNEIGALVFDEQEEARRNILKRNGIKTKDLDYLVSNLELELRSSNCHTLILSAESIFRYSQDGLKLLKKIFNELLGIKSITIVFFTRNPVDFYNSYFQQMAKSSFPIDYGSNVEEDLYSNSLTNLANVFGDENLTVLSFEESLRHTYGPAGYFLEKIGVQSIRFKSINFLKVNEGISHLSYDLLNFINDIEPLVSDGVVSKFRSPSDTRCLENLSGEKFYFDLDAQKKIFKITKKDIVWLYEKYDIDYRSMTLKKPSSLKFSRQNLLEIKNIYPGLKKYLQSMMLMYFVNLLRRQCFFDFKNVFYIRRAVRLIKNNVK